MFVKPATNEERERFKKTVSDYFDKRYGHGTSQKEDVTLRQNIEKMGNYLFTEQFHLHLHEAIVTGLRNEGEKFLADNMELHEALMKVLEGKKVGNIITSVAFALIKVVEETSVKLPSWSEDDMDALHKN